VEPLYQQAWPWETRALRDLLIRVADDDGRLGSRADVLEALRGGPTLLEALERLLEGGDGFLIEEEAGVLFVKNLPEAQGTGRPSRRDHHEEGLEGETKEERRRRLARERTRRSRRARTESVTDATAERDAERDMVRTQVRTESVTERDMPRAVSGSSELKQQVQSQIYLEDLADEDSQVRTRQRDSVRTESVTRGAAVSVTRDARARLPSLEVALTIPVRERCQLLLAQEHLSQWCEPHAWPEVVSFHRRAREAMGLGDMALAPWRTDSTTRAIIQLLAVYPEEKLEEALRRAPADEFVRGLRDVGQWTPRVVRQLLGPPKLARKGQQRQPDEGPRYEFEVEEVG